MNLCTYLGYLAMNAFPKLSEFLHCLKLYRLVEPLK